MAYSLLSGVLALNLASCSKEAPSPDVIISGVVIQAGGPAPGTKVLMAHNTLSFYSKGRLVKRTAADNNARYMVSIPPGQYEVEVSNCPAFLITVKTPNARQDIICSIP
jgi:hypothetical protein